MAATDIGSPLEAVSGTDPPETIPRASGRNVKTEYVCRYPALRHFAGAAFQPKRSRSEAASAHRLATPFDPESGAKIVEGNTWNSSTRATQMASRISRSP